MNQSKKLKIIVISLIVLFLILFILAPMAITIIAYETNFNIRTQTNTSDRALVFEDYPNLARESISFSSNKDQILRGYIYSSNQEPLGDKKALIVFSHGYLGTHTNYLNQIDYFVQQGYKVLAFDNTGCGISNGDSMLGLAQSPIDLDYALRFVENNSDLKDNKILLYGHSWGGYAVTAVLNYGHPIAGVVSRSGFSNSRDMLVEYGSNLYGDFIGILSPYAYIYEKCKFGNAVDLNGIKGINQSTCPILLLHSKDDTVISLKNSLLIHKEEYTNSDRIQTILYEDKTHDVVASYDSLTYRKNLQEDTVVDKEVFHQLDERVMKSIVEFFDRCISK